MVGMDQEEGTGSESKLGTAKREARLEAGAISLRSHDTKGSGMGDIGGGGQVAARWEAPGSSMHERGTVQGWGAAA